MRNCKAIIHKLYFPVDGNLHYNVQLWRELTDGKSDYSYAGYGKYFKTIQEAEQYAKDHSTVPAEYRIEV